MQYVSFVLFWGVYVVVVAAVPGAARGRGEQASTSSLLSSSSWSLLIGSFGMLVVCETYEDQAISHASRRMYNQLHNLLAGGEATDQPWCKIKFLYRLLNILFSDAFKRETLFQLTTQLIGKS